MLPGFWEGGVPLSSRLSGLEEPRELRARSGAEHSKDISGPQKPSRLDLETVSAGAR